MQFIGPKLTVNISAQRWANKLDFLLYLYSCSAVTNSVGSVGSTVDSTRARCDRHKKSAVGGSKQNEIAWVKDGIIVFLFVFVFHSKSSQQQQWVFVLRVTMSHAWKIKDFIHTYILQMQRHTDIHAQHIHALIHTRRQIRW